jgi:23S rRNA pseudouridine1911/1915/1917 synthase
VILNQGFSYRERLGSSAGGHTVLSYLVARYPHSDAQVWRQRLVRGEVLLEGVVADGSEPLRVGQTLTWNRPPWLEPTVPLSYDRIYQDQAILVVNKPSGLPTVPAGGFLQNTLLSLVRQKFPPATPIHRLGRATSGLVLFALNPQVASRLCTHWSRVEKVYRALASGVATRDEYAIATPIGQAAHPRLGRVWAASPQGKPSFSRAWVKERRADSTVFAVQIQTGRPHQIRIHLASIGHPLVGDPLYAAGGQLLPKQPGLPGEGGYLLHAERLAFEHPDSGEWMELEAPLPQAWKASGP